MATQYLNQQQIYAEPTTEFAPRRLPIGQQLASMPFRDFAEKTTAEADDIRARFAAELAEDGDEEPSAP